MASTSEKAAAWLRSVADMVIEKGKSYGDSIGEPVRIFSKADQKDGLRVRIDDKLSRIANGSEYQGEDTLRDLVGYLALLASSDEKAVRCKGGNLLADSAWGDKGWCDKPDCRCDIS